MKVFIVILFKIKTILQVDHKGEIILINKKLTIEKSFCYIIKKIPNYIKNKKILIHILTTGNSDLTKRLKLLLQKEFKLNDILEILSSSPAIETHIGDNF
ncbi:MAG: DegV family protein [Candidatus Phytoplasma stylosanthis]|uniref:DegV family protein n=1 Tax=Candidatus Phytoplasma stylosanthis TaxID=2798314 RepID=UPI00293B4C4F|nr:DegV family protein [Candidatus Phytoplasma stylosanthis]MDV3170801.1 DegV family protein [Candidatus Phytoplasma stylosanthis]MDV3174185.1 DegV family protein [Candidatus Phytoplasma stylosanthis]MDV3202524.1 DegV family protein [Candidatus Phytoplasma stylosanthis]